MGPKPSAAPQAQPIRARPTTSRNGALAASSHLIDSMPRTMNQTFTAQNSMKQRNSPAEIPSHGSD
jgi:hypothetical protein